MVKRARMIWTMLKATNISLTKVLIKIDLMLAGALNKNLSCQKEKMVAEILEKTD